jgi:hypothetical protein
VRSSSEVSDEGRPELACRRLGIFFFCTAVSHEHYLELSTDGGTTIEK